MQLYMGCSFDPQYFATNFGIYQLFIVRYSNDLQHCDKHYISFHWIYINIIIILYKSYLLYGMRYFPAISRVLKALQTIADNQNGLILNCTGVTKILFLIECFIFS